jgi:predicted nicotinamide N-methyase
VIELGAGCGLAGLGMALLGCDVVTTDQVEVLPLLLRNVERNKSWISQSNSDSGLLSKYKNECPLITIVFIHETCHSHSLKELRT